MNEREIFMAALQQESQTARQAFVEEACRGADELRREVEALLDAHAQAITFLETPLQRLPDTVLAVCPEQPGTWVGSYQLIEKIGEGGFGQVFLAEQHQPVRRQVALKVLKPGLDRRPIIARFEAERQALALMDHPNIAHVFDGGTTVDGRPYFVMELVRGMPITNYCDQHKLALRARLELFLAVSQAVQHAHQRGIIHRDLKPSNVLVTVQDGVPMVKVIDFGIAKALGQHLTDKTLCTGAADLLGTPLYMSPEQLALDGLDIDTRADIYALGLLLYELLTSTTPFDAARLKKASFDELRRIIREEEPPRPSARLGARRPGRALRGELDWIVLKALEKDRARRYESAGAFAADVEHYLRGEAVAACPPSALYRLRKFARRNKLLFVTTTIVAMTLLAATPIVTWKWLEAEEARGRATTAEQDARKDQERALTAERQARLGEAEALVGKAHGTRLSRQRGQRFDALAALGKAAAIGRELGQPAAWFDAVRNEAIAALALPDVRLVKEWPNQGRPVLDISASLERYVRWDHDASFSLHRLADDAVQCRVVCNSFRDYHPLISADGRYIAFDLPNRVRVWDTAGATPSKVLDEPGRETQFSPDSRQLAYQQPNGSVTIFDLATRKVVQCLAPMPLVQGMAFHPRNRWLAVAYSGRPEAHVRDLQTGAVLATVPVGKDPFPVTAWHPDGNILATAGNRVICLWDVAARKELGKLEGITGGGINLAFNSTGTVLASTGWEGKLRLWETYTGRQILNLVANVHSVRVGQNGRFLATMELDNRLGLWEITVPDEYRTLTCGPASRPLNYRRPYVSSDNRLLVAGTEPGGAALWDLASGKQLAFLKQVNGETHALLQTPHGPGGALESPEALLTNCHTGLLRWPIDHVKNDSLWRIGPPERLPLPGTPTEIGQSADGRVLATLNQSYLKVLHADQPDRPMHFGSHTAAGRLAVSPDGRWVATGLHRHPGGAKLWEVLTDPKSAQHAGRLIKNLPVGEGSRVFFSSNGKWLLTIGNGTLRLWQVGTWQELTWPQPINGIAAHFSPDSRLLAVESGAGATRLLDPQTGREYARLEDPNQERAWYYGFSPDGTLLVSAAGDGPALHVWNLRLLRERLAQMQLDWDLPSYPPPSPPGAQASHLELVLFDNWVQRGLDHELRGEGKQAQAAYRKAAADTARLFAANDGPKDPLVWLEHACLQLQLGDTAGYHKLCTRMFQRFAKNKHAGDITTLTRTCLLGPDALSDMAPVLGLAQARAAMITDADSAQVLGLACYRAGQHDKAVDILEKALRTYPDWNYNACNWLVLAMARRQLGHTAECKRLLKKAQGWITDKLHDTSHATDFVPRGWHWREWLMLQLLLREAEALVQDSDNDQRNK